MPIKIGDPHLFGKERTTFEASVAKSRRYSEFGAGGSSLLAAKMSVEEIVVVDSDEKWIDAVRMHPEISAKISDRSMSVLHGDIGPVRDWGNPIDRNNIQKWPNYIAASWAEWHRRGALPDLIFVDGRFRVACCLSVVVAFAGGTKGNPLVMMHDFNDERPCYRDVLEYFDLERLDGTLALLRIREDASVLGAMVELLRRQFDFG